jgi:hypothetical protein
VPRRVARRVHGLRLPGDVEDRAAEGVDCGQTLDAFGLQSDHIPRPHQHRRPPSSSEQGERGDLLDPPARGVRHLVLVHQDGCGHDRAEVLGAAEVVWVGVGQQDSGHVRRAASDPIQRRQHPSEIPRVTGIDQRHRVAIADQHPPHMPGARMPHARDDLDNVHIHRRLPPEEPHPGPSTPRPQPDPASSARTSSGLDRDAPTDSAPPPVTSSDITTSLTVVDMTVRRRRHLRRVPWRGEDFFRR